MPPRTYLPTSTLQLADEMDGQQQLQDALSSVRFHAALPSALDGLRQVAASWQPLPIVVSPSPQDQPVQPAPRPAAMPSVLDHPPETPTTPGIPGSREQASRADTTSPAPGIPDSPPTAPSGTAVDTSTWRGGGSPNPAQSSGPAPERGGDLRAYARAAAQRAGVDPDIFERQINQESGFNPRAVSPAGAQGIAQFMPNTARGVGLADPFEPYSALDAAARHMADNLKRNNGDYRLALAAYNAGQGNVDRYGEGVFGSDFANGQTRDYVNIILGPGGTPTAGAPSQAPAATPSGSSGAALPSAAPTAGPGASDTVTIEHIDDHRRLVIPRANLAGYMVPPAPGVPAMWRVVDGQGDALRQSLADTSGQGATMARMALSDAQPMPEDASSSERYVRSLSEPDGPLPRPLENSVPYDPTTGQTGEPDGMPAWYLGDQYRQPLLPTDPEASTGAEYDPRDADQGPRELGYATPAATYGDAGDSPQVPMYQPQYGPPLSEAGPEQPSYPDPAAPSTSYLERPAPPEPPSNPFQPLYDTTGQIVGYVQDRVGQTLGAAPSVARRAVERATGPLAAAADAAQQSYADPFFQQAPAPARAAKIVSDTFQAYGDAAARRVAAELGVSDEELFSILGYPISGQDIAGFAGGQLLDPTNYLGAGEADPLMAVARGVGREVVMPAARSVASAGREALEQGAGALGRAGSRIQEGLAANARNVAAADARMAAEGSTVAPGTLGQIPEQFGRPYPDIRRDVNGVVRETLGQPSSEMLADSRYPRDAVHPDLRAAGIGPRITPQVDTSSRLNAGFGVVPEEAPRPRPTPRLPDEAQLPGSALPAEHPSRGGLGVPEAGYRAGTPEAAVEQGLQDAARTSGTRSPDLDSAGVTALAPDALPNPTAPPIVQRVNPDGTPKVDKFNRPVMTESNHGTPPSLSGLRDALQAGLQSRRWYQQFADWAASKVGKENFNEFRNVMAITSALTDPENNMVQTLGVMKVARELNAAGKLDNMAAWEEALAAQRTPSVSKGAPVLDKDGNPVMVRWKLEGYKIRQIFDLYNKGAVEVGSGAKTSSYSGNFLTALMKTYDPNTTVDVWMARAMNYASTDFLQGQTVANDAAYRASHAVFNWIAREHGMVPHEAQAAIWFTVKTLTEQGGPEIQALLRKGKLSEAIEKGRALLNPDNIRGDINTIERSPKVAHALETSSSAFGSDVPSPGLAADSDMFYAGKGKIKRPVSNEQRAAAAEMANQQAPTVTTSMSRLQLAASGLENGQFPWLEIPHRVTTHGNSATVSLPGGNVDTARYVASTLGDATNAESMLIHSPASTAPNTGGIVFDTGGRPMRPEHLGAITNRLDEAGVPYVVGPGGTYVAVVAEQGADLERLYNGVRSVQDLGIPGLGANSYAADVERVAREDFGRHAADLGNRFGPAGSSDLQQRALSDIRAASEGAGRGAAPGASDTALSAAGYAPAIRGPDRLAAVNRALGQGVASAVSGGVGAQINQQANPDDPNAAIKGFAVGAVLPYAASRGAMALARRAGATAGAEGGALATLGNVPPSKIRRPMLPGMEELPARRTDEIPLTLKPGDAQAVSEMRATGSPSLPTLAPHRGVLRAIADAVEPWGARANIVRYGGMLSDSASHLYNAASNLIGMVGDTAVTPVAATMDAARVGSMRAFGQPAERQVFFSEVPARLAGQWSGVKSGLQAAGDIMRTGMRPEDASKLDHTARGFNSGSGAVDFAFEYPLRALAAADAIFRGAAQGGHMGAEALAAARRANKTRDITPEMLREAMKDPALLERVQKLSARSVLQEDRMLTDWYRHAMRYQPESGAARLGADALKAVVSVEVPFVKTPYNVMAQGMGMTPAGLLGVIQDVHEGKAARDVEMRLARVALGTGVMAAASADYAAGNLTGPYPSDPKEASTLPPGWRPWSRKFEVGGQTYYVPLAAAGPFAVPAVVAILAGEAEKKGNSRLSPEWAGAVAAGLGRYAVQQTFFDGVTQVAKVFDERTGDANLERHVEQIAAQFSPHVIGGGALGREIQRVMGMPSRDPEGAIEALLATHPATAGMVEPAQDVLGRPRSLGVSGPAGALVRAGAENDASVIRAFRRAGEGLPLRAPKAITDPSGGRAIALTPAQQKRWQRVFGAALSEGWSNRGNPTEQAALRAVESQARATANDTILGRR